jgi:hypothetical protein
MKAWITALSTAALATLALACSSGPAASEEALDADESSQELFSPSWKKIAGAWDGGASLRGVVFTDTPEKSGHHFFADVDNGLRCIQAPCPSTARIEGWYTVTWKYVRLYVTSDDFGYSGRYTYKVTQTGLTLTKVGAPAAGGMGTDTVTKQLSYCAAAEDCDEQDLIHPACVGQWTCGSTNRCAWKCGYVVTQTCDDVKCAPNEHCEMKGINGSAVPVCLKGVKCGNAICGDTEYCCNPIASICALKGMLCIQ